MIAAGLCMMGGCFAQNEQTACVDTYWPAEYVEIPAATPTIRLYVLSVPSCPALSELHLYTKRQHLGSSKTSSVSYGVVRNVDAAWHIANLYSSSEEMALQSQSSAITEAVGIPYPEIEVYIEAGQMRCPQTRLIKDCIGAVEGAGGEIRVLVRWSADVRFWISVGEYGVKWCAIPMKSPGADMAVYDIEQDILIEI